MSERRSPHLSRGHRRLSIAREILLKPVVADSEAFVFTQREPLDVVYVEGAFFGSGNLLKGLKNWTRILVHELSHREQKTVDKFYAWQGIKPVVGGFPSADAIVNAESWAFFCADAAGALTDGDRQSALQ